MGTNRSITAPVYEAWVMGKGADTTHTTVVMSINYVKGTSNRQGCKLFFRVRKRRLLSRNYNRFKGVFC